MFAKFFTCHRIAHHARIRILSDGALSVDAGAAFSNFLIWRKDVSVGSGVLQAVPSRGPSGVRLRQQIGRCSKKLENEGDSTR